MVPTTLSPGALTSDEIFCRYLLIVGIVLVAAGFALVIARYLLKRDIGGVGATYLGWLIMLPILLAAIWLGRVWFIGLITLVSILGFKEFARATGLYRDWIMTAFVYLAILCVGAASLMADPWTGKAGWYGLFRDMPVYIVALLLTVPIVRNRTSGQLQTVALAILGFIYIGWMFGHLGFLANTSQMVGFLLYLILAVEIADISAFTCGKLLGHRKLRSNISPNKTIAGAVGALLVSMALPWVLGFSFPEGFGTTEKILTGLIVGIGGQLGDLTMSFIKRDLAIKDMGRAIPGHGGILDRIDSLVYTAPLFMLMLQVFHGLDTLRAG